MAADDKEDAEEDEDKEADRYFESHKLLFLSFAAFILIKKTFILSLLSATEVLTC